MKLSTFNSLLVLRVERRVRWLFWGPPQHRVLNRNYVDDDRLEAIVFFAKGHARVWTRDLLICSQPLCHWGTYPTVFPRPTHVSLSEWFLSWQISCIPEKEPQGIEPGSSPGGGKHCYKCSFHQNKVSQQRSSSYTVKMDSQNPPTTVLDDSSNSRKGQPSSELEHSILTVFCWLCRPRLPE